MVLHNKDVLSLLRRARSPSPLQPDVPEYLLRPFERALRRRTAKEQLEALLLLDAADLVLLLAEEERIPFFSLLPLAAALQARKTAIRLLLFYPVVPRRTESFFLAAFSSALSWSGPGDSLLLERLAATCLMIGEGASMPLRLSAGPEAQEAALRRALELDDRFPFSFVPVEEEIVIGAALLFEKSSLVSSSPLSSLPLRALPYLQSEKSLSLALSRWPGETRLQEMASS